MPFPSSPFPKVGSLAIASNKAECRGLDALPPSACIIIVNALMRRVARFPAGFEWKSFAEIVIAVLAVPGVPMRTWEEVNSPL